MFYNIIVNDIAPIFVIMMLGYAGAKFMLYPTKLRLSTRSSLILLLPAALFCPLLRKLTVN